MKPELTATLERAQTLGSRLDALGRELADRHITDLPWLPPLGRVLNRAAELAEPAGERFERHEGGEVKPLPDRALRRSEPPFASPAPGSRPRPVRSSEDESQEAAQSEAARQQTATHEPAPDLTRKRRLPADVRASLRQIAGAGADEMIVLDGPASDVITRNHGADAVTLGRTVHVRSGRFDPATAEGFGLLAHEATHVTASLGDPTHRGHAPGRAAEEGEALRREAQARAAETHTPQATPRYPSTAVPSPIKTTRPQRPSVSASPPAEPHAHAMTASTSRSVPTDSSPSVDLDRLRRDVIGDVMRQLRSEFERGA